MGKKAAQPKLGPQRSKAAEFQQKMHQDSLNAPRRDDVQREVPRGRLWLSDQL